MEKFIFGTTSDIYNNYEKKMKIVKKIKNIVLGSNNKLSRFLLQLKRDYRLRMFKLKDEKVLEICGGINPYYPDSINVDVLDHPNVDVLANLNEPLPFGDDEIDKIISIATLEHFNIINLSNVLKEFYRILKQDGILEIGVPSLSKILRYYQVNGCDNKVIRYLHGAQKDEYDLHLCILDFKRFKEELENCGYYDINETEYDYPFHSKDFMMKIIAKKAAN
jgi:predicted SAM-dependent methyltransferase